MIYHYREPKELEQFVIAGDPGEGHDSSTFVVLSKFDASVVMAGKSQEESSQLGHTLNGIGKWINSKTKIYPSIAVERNAGTATIYVLRDLNYPELFRMPNSFTKEEMQDSEQYGWITSSATRPKMLDDLAMAIRQHAIKIPSNLIVDELYSFVRHPRTGKPQAGTNSNDDLVMALAIAWQMYQIVPAAVRDDDTSDWDMLAEENRRYMITKGYRT